MFLNKLLGQIVLFIIAFPVYLSLAARSFEFYVKRNNYSTEMISQFLINLPYPLKLMFAPKRWYGFFNSIEIMLDKYFHDLNLNYIIWQRIVLSTIMGLLIVAITLGIINEKQFEVRFIYLFFVILHLYNLYISSLFGSRLKSKI